MTNTSAVFEWICCIQCSYERLDDVHLRYSDVSPAGFHPHSDAFVDDFVDFVDAGLINGYLC